MIISTCGFGNTGASAVLDFLKGYENISISKGVEFQLIHMPDGLLDLKYHLTKNRERITCNSAIKRFQRLSDSIFVMRLIELGCDYKKLANDFINSLEPITWLGKSAYDPYDVSGINHRSLRSKLKRTLYGGLRHINPNIQNHMFKNRYMLFLDEESFDKAANEFLRKIFISIGYDESKDMLFDMLVSGCDPKAGTEFLGDHKIIVVYRDPKDLYVRAHTHQSTNGFMPCAKVDEFIRYYRNLMEYSVRNEEALYIQYEDLIYNYFPTTEKIMKYLGYDKRPENEFKYFNPDVSVKYTNNDFDCVEDVEKIRCELKQYLYEFKPYIPVDEQRKQYEGDKK